MSRLSIALIASVILVGTAGADTFRGWQYAAPPGYTVHENADHVAFTKHIGSSFCSLALFEPRALERSAQKERAFEWYNVVTHAAKAKVMRRVTAKTKHGVDVSATTATVVDAEGVEYAATHFVVMPPGMIGSVLLTSSTVPSLRTCERLAMAFVDSLAIDWMSPRFHDPEARPETPIGRWAVVASISREYTFGSDGTYRFHSEGADRVVNELGKYTLRGNQLTLIPIEATSAVVGRGVARTTALPREKTTYTWGKRYVVDTNEWQLVLTPKKPTTRDGIPDATTPAGRAYRYSDQAKPAWKYAAQPGV